MKKYYQCLTIVNFRLDPDETIGNPAQIYGGTDWAR